jgi:hypothetical protein
LKLIGYLNILFAVLLLIDSFTIIAKATKKEAIPRLLADCTDCPKPDVYLVVVDGYAGVEQLKSDFSFDNSNFLGSLRQLGFRVLTGSKSNYIRTEFSMASLLNMEYHSLRNYRVTDKSLQYCFGKISINKVVHAFRQQGYDFINNSIFDIENDAAPVGNSFLVKGADLIESETLWSRIKRDVYVPLLMTRLRNTWLYSDFAFQPYHSDSALLSNLSSLTKEKIAVPRFVYTHLLMTHFPYYFKENGELNKAEDIRVDNYDNKPLYLENLKYTNQRLLSVVNMILKNSDRPPVILLLGDHGFRYSSNPAYAFSNLAAVYLPNGDYSRYYDTLSNVNQFRVLFNTVFKQQLPLLKDVNGERPDKISTEDNIGKE